MRKARSEERALWHRAMHDVQPLHRERRAPIDDAPELEVVLGSERSPPPIPSPAHGRALGRELDRRTAQRLKRGQMPIEARLDLHGMTQAEAHEALARFIARSHAAGLRAVIVITGKSGVLHGAVPRWLEEGENRACILGSARAQPQHGGAGALYLLLRRQR